MTDIGDVVTFDFEVRVDNVLTNATVTLTVTLPDGTTTSPSVSSTGTGKYTASYLTTQNGRHTYRWSATGAATAADSGVFWVGAGVTVQMVKDRLDKTLTVDDAEIETMLDAALVEYETWVGPVAGTVVENHNGGGTSLVLRSPQVSAITAATYSDGTTITLTDLDLDTATGIVHWGYGTAGYFTGGNRNVVLTYTVGAVPANHREAIAADVAGYFAATQQGPTGPEDDLGYTAAWRGAPAVMFPRIRALAGPSVA